MTIDEKRELRLTLLKELYDYNEETGGYKVIDLNDPMTKEDKNRFLAYEYLEDKGLIQFKPYHESAYIAKINSYGIDHVEEVLSNQK